MEEIKRAKELYNINQELSELAQSTWKTFHPSTELENVVLFMQAKAHKTHQAAMELANKGYGQDAAILVRSLFELSVSIRYICQTKKKRAKRFLNFDSYNRNKMYEIMESDRKLKPILKKAGRLGDENRRKTAQEAIQALSLFEYHGNEWSGLKWDKLSKKVGMLHKYKTDYKLLSNIAHSNATSINDYLSSKDKGFIINAGPHESWVEESLGMAFIYYTLILVSYCITFSLSIEKQLDDLASRHNKVMKQTHLTIEDSNQDEAKI